MGKAYRWMSLYEFEKLSAGCTIMPYVTMRNARTTGSGIFFLPEDYSERMVGGCWDDGTPVEYDGMTPEMSIRFLRGIVSEDVMVEFEINCAMTNSEGTYADPVKCDWYATVSVPEQCVPSYDRNTMIPLRYFIPEKYSSGKGDWYEFN